MDGATVYITITPVIDDIQALLDIQRSLDAVATGFDSEAVELRSLWVGALFGEA
jgi:hypothetical protein